MNHLRKSSLPVVTRKVTFIDFVVFQAKLAVDGLKDLVLINLSVIAILIDLLSGGRRRPRRFYAVMRLGHRFDRWLRLYSAKGFSLAEDGGREEEYLSGAGAEDAGGGHMGAARGGGMGAAAGGRMLGSDADTLIDRVEGFVRRQSQAGGSGPEWPEEDPRKHARDPDYDRNLRDYDRDLEEFDRDLESRKRGPRRRRR